MSTDGFGALAHTRKDSPRLCNPWSYGIKIQCQRPTVAVAQQRPLARAHLVRVARSRSTTPVWRAARVHGPIWRVAQRAVSERYACCCLLVMAGPATRWLADRELDLACGNETDNGVSSWQPHKFMDPPPRRRGKGANICCSMSGCATALQGQQGLRKRQTYTPSARVTGPFPAFQETSNTSSGKRFAFSTKSVEFSSKRVLKVLQLFFIVLYFSTRDPISPIRRPSSNLN